MIEAAAPGSTTPRAFLSIGGISVARLQLGIALALKCDRIVCLAAALEPEIVAMQHAAEAAGAQFHLISAPRQLVGLVTASDEVIVLGDGLFVSAAEVVALLEQGQAVLVQPIEQGLAAGFERIDLNHAAAGAMRIPGRLVERIADLPSDCDAASALQRIALQAGIRQRSIPAPLDAGLFWMLIRSEDEAHAVEPLWIRRRTRDDESRSPSRFLALMAVRGFGPALLHAGSGPGAAVIAAAFLALLGAGAGWLGWIATAFVLLAGGWILREIAVLLARIEADPLAVPRRLDSKLVYGWLLDAVMVLVAGWSLPVSAGAGPGDRFFAPFMLTGLLRLMPRIGSGRIAAWMGDRALLAALLCAASLSGLGIAAIEVAAVIVLIAGFALPRGQLRLTPP